MRNPFKTQRSTDIGLLSARLPVGIMLVIAGCNKLAAKGGFKGFADANAAYLPKWASHDAGMIVLQLLPIMAVVTGLMILLGLITRLGGFLASVVLLSILLATKSFTENGLPHAILAYLGLTLLLFLAGGGNISLDGMFFGKKSGGFGE
jgi:uncharacterized membrane protein YphA (DoxX/SURF4 family)